MVMPARLDITPEIFSKIVRTGMIWSDMDAKVLAEKLTKTGYPTTYQTVLSWLRGERKDISLNLVKALARATHQPEEYYLGELSALRVDVTQQNFRRAGTGIVDVLGGDHPTMPLNYAAPIEEKIALIAEDYNLL